MISGSSDGACQCPELLDERSDPGRAPVRSAERCFLFSKKVSILMKVTELMRGDGSQHTIIESSHTKNLYIRIAHIALHNITPLERAVMQNAPKLFYVQLVLRPADNIRFLRSLYRI